MFELRSSNTANCLIYILSNNKDLYNCITLCHIMLHFQHAFKQSREKLPPPHNLIHRFIITTLNTSHNKNIMCNGGDK